jgi:hypothetical protein
MAGSFGWHSVYSFVLARKFFIKMIFWTFRSERVFFKDRSLRVYVTPDAAAAAATATCDCLLRLFASFEEHDAYITGYDDGEPAPISGSALSLSLSFQDFFQESQSCLRKVTLSRTTLSKEQCLALATMSRLDVELDLRFCRLADGAAGAFVECLQSDRGPVKMNQCRINIQILTSALTGG